ncbi:hypothetical protein B0H66DRAFT_615282 [Apodospora peruviana]|uniref:Uncharacterized protein n=1 Tax=Apodospora peruviana TaxID=516989 RepID=A0AAE0MA28_9PEZI|nr:hypothetical protein B0H66DRAFT_615282 [Apodospora peruviana]
MPGVYLSPICLAFRKLTGEDNYNRWRTNVLNVLESYNFTRYIESAWRLERAAIRAAFEISFSDNVYTRLENAACKQLSLLVGRAHCLFPLPLFNGIGFAPDVRQPKEDRRRQLSVSTKGGSTPGDEEPQSSLWPTPTHANVPRFRQLTCEGDYRMWEANVRNVLQACGLYDYIEHSVPEPARAYQKMIWNRQRAAIRAGLEMSFSHEVFTRLETSAGI